MKRDKIKLRAGFTLAELLAAMMVFSIIMLACANLVNQASLSFKMGLNQVEAQDAGRTLNQEFFRMFSGAITAERFPFYVKNDFVTGLEGGGSDAFFLVTTSAGKLWAGCMQEILCWVETEPVESGASIRRGRLFMRNNDAGSAADGNEIYDTGYRSTIAKTFQFGSGMSDDLSSYASLLAENIWSFKVTVYDFNGDEVTVDYDSKLKNHELPARVDIEIKVLDEETWAKHASPSFASLAANNLKTIRFSHSYANKGTWK